MNPSSKVDTIYPKNPRKIFQRQKQGSWKHWIKCQIQYISICKAKGVLKHFMWGIQSTKLAKKAYAKPLIKSDEAIPLA
jgi:hypothetical protein